jgi:hypothetical protein
MNVPVLPTPALQDMVIIATSDCVNLLHLWKKPAMNNDGRGKIQLSSLSADDFNKSD